MKIPQRRQSERITPEMLELYRTWTDEAAAQVFDTRFRAIELRQSQTFTELGIMVLECERRELWKHAVKLNGEHPRTLSDWMVDALPVSHGTAFEAKDCAIALAEIPVEEREQIPRGNQYVMAKKISRSLALSPEIRKQAKEQKPKKFVEMLEREHPDQHIESERPMRFKPERSVRSIIDSAIEMAKVVDDATTRENALEIICQTYINIRQDAYDEMKREGEGTAVVQ